MTLEIDHFHSWKDCYNSKGILICKQIKIKRCKNCRKEKWQHKAKTFECPSGLKTRVGYISFGPTVYEVNV